MSEREGLSARESTKNAFEPHRGYANVCKIVGINWRVCVKGNECARELRGRERENVGKGGD